MPGCGRKKEEWSGQDRKADNESKAEEKDSTKEEDPEELSMTITFVNHVGENIYALQVSPADTDDWEEDILDVDFIADGATIVLNEDGLYSEGRLLNDIENGGGWYAESDASRSSLTYSDEGVLRDIYTPMQITFTPFSQLY